jgi:PPOX class probable F420-dependent enzyme
LPLSKSELEKFLQKSRMAHLATATTTGKPRVNPIWYAYQDGVFYFTTRLRRVKGQHIQRNPAVALSIATEVRPYLAVCAYGKAKVIKQGRDEWLKKISFRYGEAKGKAWLARAVDQPDRVVMKLKPDRVLSWNYGRGDSERQEKGESMATPT